jgi:hypothetical protein
LITFVERVTKLATTEAPTSARVTKPATAEVLATENITKLATTEVSTSEHVTKLAATEVPTADVMKPTKIEMSTTAYVKKLQNMTKVPTGDVLVRLDLISVKRFLPVCLADVTKLATTKVPTTAPIAKEGPTRPESVTKEVPTSGRDTSISGCYNFACCKCH